MAVRKKKTERDIEKEYPLNQFIEKLRRLADCLEQGKKFRIQFEYRLMACDCPYLPRQLSTLSMRE